MVTQFTLIAAGICWKYKIYLQGVKFAKKLEVSLKNYKKVLNLTYISDKIVKWTNLQIIQKS